MSKKFQAPKIIYIVWHTSNFNICVRNKKNAYSLRASFIYFCPLCASVWSVGFIVKYLMQSISQPEKIKCTLWVQVKNPGLNLKKHNTKLSATRIAPHAPKPNVVGCIIYFVKPKKWECTIYLPAWKFSQKFTMVCFKSSALLNDYLKSSSNVLPTLFGRWASCPQAAARPLLWDRRGRKSPDHRRHKWDLSPPIFLRDRVGLKMRECCVRTVKKRICQFDSPKIWLQKTNKLFVKNSGRWFKQG